METGETHQINRYAYADNDPINTYDPTGMDGANVKIEASGHYGLIAGEVSIKAGVATEGGPKWLGGYDAGFTLSFGGGAGSGVVPVDAQVDLGGEHFEGGFQEASKETWETNASGKLGGGVAIDVAIDAESGENASTSVSAVAGTPNASIALTKTDEVTISLVGVHQNGRTTTWSELADAVAKRVTRTKPIQETG